MQQQALDLDKVTRSQDFEKKEEIRQDQEQKTAHRSNVSEDRLTATIDDSKTGSSDDIVHFSSYEGESTEVGIEVSVKGPSSVDDSSCSGSVEGGDDGHQDLKRDPSGDRASSGHSSIVFNFSGISKTRSTELTVGGTRVVPRAASTSTTEFQRLFDEIDKIVTRLSEGNHTPKHANHGNTTSQADSAFHQYYFSAKTLTSIYNTGGELSFTMHAQIMKQIGALDADSALEQKREIVKDLFKMGIRVTPEPPKEVESTDLQQDHSLGEDPAVNREDRSIDGSEDSGENNSALLEESESDSSDDIDKRWEAYRAKYMARCTPTSSDEVDDRWEKLRERALAGGVEKCDSGALSSTSNFERDLILDCIETGLPSPRHTQNWRGIKTPPRQSKNEKVAEGQEPLDAPASQKHLVQGKKQGDLSTPSDESSEVPPVSSLRRHGQPEPDDECDYQPSRVRRTPSLKSSCELVDLHHDVHISNVEQSVEEKGMANQDEHCQAELNLLDTKRDISPEIPKNQPQGIWRALDESDSATVASELSSDGAVNHFKSLSRSGRQVCSHENGSKEKEDIGISDQSIEEGLNSEYKKSADGSESTSKQGSEKSIKGPIRFLREVLSSATGSCTARSKQSAPAKNASQESHMYDSKAIQDPFHDNAGCPQIEVTWLPSQIHGSENGSKKRGNSKSNSSNILSEESLQDSEVVETDRSLTKEQSSKNHLQEEETIEDSGDEDTSFDGIIISRNKQSCERDLLEVSSSLTGGTDDHKRKSQSNEVDSQQKERSATSRGQPIDLSILSTKGKSFESKSSYSGHGVPSWRLCASESFSDFSLQVLNEKTGEAVNYHVHRHMLAVGPRKSQYMEGVFHSETSDAFQLILDEKSSALMPNLLDFIYCHDYFIDVTTENVMSLRELSRVFKVLPLVKEATAFILKDMKSSNLSTYISEAAFFKDEQVQELIVRRCSEKIQSITVMDPLWAVMEPGLFLRVLSAPIIKRGPYLSVLVKEYILLHKYEIGLDTFIAMTDAIMIPILDRAAALPLIELCEEYESNQCEPLQKRCAHTMACFWKTTPHDDRHRLFALLRNLPSSFTVDFLEIVESGRSLGAEQPIVSVMTTSEKRDTDTEAKDFTALTVDDLCHGLAGEDGFYNNNTGDEVLTWRMDPRLSFSDWTIKVIHLHHKRGDIYHIHKQIVSLGPYRSEFFSQHFLSTNTKHVLAHGVTTIELDHKAALAFPHVLDFIYSPNHEIRVCSENAVVLRFLGRILGVTILSKQVLDFIAKDISLANVMGYIQGAYDFEDARILVVASMLCASEIEKIDMDSPLLEQFKPEFFAQIAASRQIKDRSKCHLTILITKYFSIHDLDGVILAELLKHVDVPRIDCVSALKLLKILSQFEGSQEIETFDNLQRRCAKILTENWNDLRDNHRDEVFSVFPLLHSTLLTEIFDVIDHQYMVQHYESMSMQSRLVKRYRAQVAEAHHLREQEVSLLRKELEERTAQMLAIQKSFEQKLGKVNDSLNRRTGRSAAYGIHLPLSPTSGMRFGHQESRIPTIRTRSPSALTSQRMRAAREEAIRELQSTNPCCPYSPIEARDDKTEGDSATVPDPTDDQIAANVDAEKKSDENSNASSTLSTLAEETRKVKQEQAKRALKTEVVAKSLPGTPMATESKDEGASFFTFPWSGKSAVADNTTLTE
jgi:hypothetical protein